MSIYMIYTDVGYWSNKDNAFLVNRHATRLDLPIVSGRQSTAIQLDRIWSLFIIRVSTLHSILAASNDISKKFWSSVISDVEISGRDPSSKAGTRISNFTT